MNAVSRIIMTSIPNDMRDNNSDQGHTANLSSVSSEFTYLSGNKRIIPHISEPNNTQRQSFHRLKKNKSNHDPFKDLKKGTK